MLLLLEEWKFMLEPLLQGGGGGGAVLFDRNVPPCQHNKDEDLEQLITSSVQKVVTEYAYKILLAGYTTNQTRPL